MKERYLFRNQRSQIGAWIKLFIFIISLNSVQCSVNILFAVTKGIVSFIACMQLASQEGKCLCSLTGTVSNKLCKE